MTMPLPFPWTPGSEPLESADFQNRVQANLEALAKSAGQTNQYPAWRAVGATGEPAFQNSWVNFGAVGEMDAKFYKDALGIVRCTGLVKNGTLAATVFVLPVGYRPSAPVRFAGIANNGVTQILGFWYVAASGAIQLAQGANTWADLSSIAFRAEA